jgi:hypothetical protein
MAGTFGESLVEFLTRVEGAYGLGPQMPPVLDLIKATGLTAGGNQLVYTDFFTQTYGRKVWDVLNNQTKFFNIIRKVPFGTTVGWRNRSARNASTSPVLENKNLPDVQKQTYQQIWSPPRAIVTMMGVTEQSQYLAGLEGGIGDALAVEQEFGALDHVKDVNVQSLQRVQLVCTTGGTTGSAILKPFTGCRVGDCFYSTDDSSIPFVITAVSPTDGKHSFTTLSGGVKNSLTTNSTYVCVGRGGVSSIEDVVEVDGRTMAGAANGNVKCYNWGVLPGTSTNAATARTAGSLYNAAAGVVDNGGVPQYLETEILDQAIRDVRLAGGEPDIIISNFDQLDRVDQLLQGMRRYMPEATFQVKRGGEATLPGFQAGFQLATYRGIPWFPDVDIPNGYYCPSNVYTEVGSDVLVLDTRWLEYGVASMTRYFESRDYLQNDMLGVKAMFFTYLELRCLDVHKQAKITDLKTV